MKEIYISLLIIIATAYFIFVSYPRRMRKFEGFVSKCANNFDCPAKFKCSRLGKCIDTRPKGVIPIIEPEKPQIERAPVPKNLR